MDEHAYHRPVMLREAVEGLAIKPDGVYVDATFGGGGHSREILKLLDKGRLIGFDQDPEAQRNAPTDKRFSLVDQNFRLMKNWVRALGVRQVDGILADLGVSSHQFDSAHRGFSIRFDAPLDMRMDPTMPRTAADIVNGTESAELARILRMYGEVENAGRVAHHLVQQRPLRTSGELMHHLERFAPRGKEHKFFAQVFQALRIEVNDELGALKDLLKQSTDLLKPGGRLVIISYHSLEDRLVKDFMRTGNLEGIPEKDFYGNLIRPFKPLHSKPLVPSDEELEVNNRSRSARLRIAERIEMKTD